MNYMETIASQDNHTLQETTGAGTTDKSNLSGGSSKKPAVKYPPAEPVAFRISPRGA